jgi:hypothetical protein
MYLCQDVRENIIRHIDDFTDAWVFNRCLSVDKNTDMCLFVDVWTARNLTKISRVWWSAVHKRKAEIVERIAYKHSKQADVDEALLYAVEHEYPELVKCLVECQTYPSNITVNLNVYLGFDRQYKPRDKWTPLALACVPGMHVFTDSAGTIHNCPARPSDTSNSIVHYLAEHANADIHAHSDFAFLAACCGGNAWAVRYLVECHGSPPGVCHGAGLCSSASNGYLEVVRYLVEKGVSVFHGWPHIYGLAKAAANGHFDVVRYLIEVADMDPTVNENAALRAAVIGKHTDIAEYLQSFTA